MIQDENDDIAKTIGQKSGKKKGKKGRGKKKSGLDEEEPLAFSTVCEDVPDMIQGQKVKVSVQSTFLTLLHLANEKGLRLVEEEGQDDFRIFKEVEK